MNSKEAYRFVVKESECAKQRENCDGNCKNCLLFTSPQESSVMYTYIAELIKQRDPELYFVSQIEELNQILKGKMHYENHG